MYRDIKHFIANCLLYYASKVPYNKTLGKLHPLLILDYV